jgi:hypothetical protein
MISPSIADVRNDIRGTTPCGAGAPETHFDQEIFGEDRALGVTLGAYSEKDARYGKKGIRVDINNDDCVVSEETLTLAAPIRSNPSAGLQVVIGRLHFKVSRSHEASMKAGEQK